MMSVLERQHRISGTGVETLEPDSRLVFAPSPTAQGVVDGSWWPRTRDPAVELPALIAAVADRLGMVDRIALNADAWDTRPPANHDRRPADGSAGLARRLGRAHDQGDR
jgi:Family of unknown function (DUF5994)